MSAVFNGQHLVIQEDGDGLTIAFSDNADEPETYLLLQRQQAPDEQDRRLGLDKVYIELNEQSHSAYGGIKQAQLRGDRLVLTFDSQTASKLGSEEDLEVKLKVDSGGLKRLRAELNKLFAGQFKFE